MNLITVQNLKKDYVNEDVVTHVLYDVDLKVEKGEFVAIMGPSGSGKSTLMHILGFLDRPTGGVYEFEGKDTTKFDDDYLAKLRNERIGFVFQAFNLLPRTTVLYKKALESVGLSHRLNYFTNQISGGEKQRVAIARALVTEPAIIFADEPTGNLDSKSGNIVMSILQRLNDEGHTIILVTHETETANHAKRVIRVKDGNIIADEKITNRIIAESQEHLTK